jgi:mannose/fructose/N-acetylgalactosamine-specific phosphotransferase system component IIC
MVQPLAVGLVLVWSTVVGLDLASVLQGLLSRPIVAATVAGGIMGNLGAGLMAGLVLELYALDVLPVGASRYPDYSVASVGAGVAAAMAPPALAVGVAGLVGLPLAALGGWSLPRLRRRNGLSVQRRLERVNAGDFGAIWELQRNGVIRDALRSLALGLVGVGAGMLIALTPAWASLPNAHYLSWAAVAGGIAAATGGAIRSAGRGIRRYLLAGGLVAGSIAMLLR